MLPSGTERTGRRLSQGHGNDRNKENWKPVSLGNEHEQRLREKNGNTKKTTKEKRLVSRVQLKINYKRIISTIVW